MRKLILFIALLAAVLFAGYTTFSREAKAPATDVPGTASTTEEAVTSNNAGAGQATSKPAAAASQAGKRVLEKGVYVTIVEYTGTAFIPAAVDISAGEEVRFVNKDNLTMRIRSDEKNSNQYYASFNQANSVPKGGTYQLSFTQPGLFTYYNLNTNPRIGGVVRVK